VGDSFLRWRLLEWPQEVLQGELQGGLLRALQVERFSSCFSSWLKGVPGEVRCGLDISSSLVSLGSDLSARGGSGELSWSPSWESRCVFVVSSESDSVVAG
jgi:hypothetical protein